LIYGVEIETLSDQEKRAAGEQGGGSAGHGDKRVNVTMTLTAANCPAAQELPEAVQRSIERLAEVAEVNVEMTFDPPWSKERMSEEAQLELGLI